MGTVSNYIAVLLYKDYLRTDYSNLEGGHCYRLHCSVNKTDYYQYRVGTIKGYIALLWGLPKKGIADYIALLRGSFLKSIIMKCSIF